MSLRILALETSSAWCGVTLLRAQAGSPAAVFTCEHQGVQEHSARLLPMIDRVLADAGETRASIDAIAFGQGPGGFTGLRVACGVAQGLAFALDRPVVPVVSHAAVAAQALGKAGQIAVVAMDARMREVYLSAYLQGADGEPHPLLAPQLMALDGLDDWVLGQVRSWSSAPGVSPDFRLCGDAALAYPDSFAALPARSDAPLRPTSEAVARLAHAAVLRGEGIAPDLAAPLYVRDKVAFTTAERALGAGGNPRVETAPPQGARA